MAATKKPAITVAIPGDETRCIDPNMRDFERNTRVVEALQQLMSSPRGAILRKETSLNANDIEQYYAERLEKAKGLDNPVLTVMFERLEKDMEDAIASLKAASAGLEAVKEMDITALPVRPRSPQPAALCDVARFTVEVLMACARALVTGD